MGADREGRSLWVWIVPAATVVITFGVLCYIGIQGAVDLPLTIPMAVVLALFLGLLSAIYLTAASSDERDEDEDDPDDRRGGRAGTRPDPSPGGATARVVVGDPAPAPAAPRAERSEPRVPVGGRPRH